MENTQYTIICHIHRCGHIEEIINKKEVRTECERLRKIMSNRLITNEVRIEVVNNSTGQIIEYWNNSENAIKF